jgi:hypothetical protein
MENKSIGAKINAYELSVHAKSGRILMKEVQKELEKINACFNHVRKFCIKRHTDLDLSLPEGLYFCEENRHLLAGTIAENDDDLVIGSITRIKRVIHFSTNIKEMYEYITGINVGLDGIAEVEK